MGKRELLQTEKEKSPSRREKKRMKLWDIAELEGGGVEVVMPGLYDKEHGWIVGTTTKKFETREAAEAAIEKGRENQRKLPEKVAIEKISGKVLYRIEDMPDGTYRVHVPGARCLSTGYFLPASPQRFEKWEDARDCLLSSLEAWEDLIKDPLLELRMKDGAKLAFSDLYAFKPDVAPTQETYDIPESIKKYIDKRERSALNSHDAGTYQRTIEVEGWEGKLFFFLKSYLQNEGKQLINECGIDDYTKLGALTPRQAVDLSTALVIDLTKYKDSDKGKRETEADRTPALTLLEMGRRYKDNESWEGNGICRNIACEVKAVFEALKANQGKYSRLRNTYCLYENTFEHEVGRGRQFEGGKHAWNTFVTVSRDGAANAITVDSTWGKRDYQTKEIKGLEYTFARMEPVVHDLAMDLDKNTPDRKEQLENIIMYYTLKADCPGHMGGHVSEIEESAYYLSRALRIMEKHNIHGQANRGFVKLCSEYYKKPEMVAKADKSEIESLWHLAQASRKIPFLSILRLWLADKDFGTNRYDMLVYDNALQRMIFEQIKNREGFDRYIQMSQARKRLEEVMPELLWQYEK